MKIEFKKSGGRYLLFLSFVPFVLFVVLSVIIFGSDLVKSFDTFLVGKISEARSEPLLAFFLLVTEFGGARVIFVSLFLLFFILIFSKEFKAAFVLVATMSALAVSIYLLKEAFHRPRPEFAYILENGYSYPSAHAAISLAFYGSVAYLFCKREVSKPMKLFVWSVVAVLTALVGASRVYLGVHFPSDVIGGYLVGLFWLLIAAALTDRGRAGG